GGPVERDRQEQLRLPSAVGCEQAAPVVFATAGAVAIDPSRGLASLSRNGPIVARGVSPQGAFCTMNPLDAAIASLAGSRLTPGGLLERRQVQARQDPLIREALARQSVLDQARAAGLSVTPEELQQAANAYRRRAGLDTAADTHAWLAAQG